jgi:hypothetical protein
VLVDILDELPLVGEGALVVAGQLSQHQAPGFPDAERVLEQIDE